jgi:hypothetical protein
MVQIPYRLKGALLAAGQLFRLRIVFFASLPTFRHHALREQLALWWHF